MNKNIIDISVPLHTQMPIWPGSTGFKLKQTMKIEEGDIANVSHMDCDVHTGTHVDAPKHFVRQGNATEHLALESLIGHASLVYLPDISAITKDILNNLNLKQNTKRLLFRTDNSELWKARKQDFHKDYVALTSDAAQWVVDQGIKLIGIDYLSIQRFDDSPLTHEILLKENVIIVEGLNLYGVEPGDYELICLPLNLVGSDGAPARAILRSI